MMLRIQEEAVQNSVNLYISYGYIQIQRSRSISIYFWRSVRRSRARDSKIFENRQKADVV